MLTKQELERLAEDRRIASEIADRGGKLPSFDGSQAVLVGAGTFMLLFVFASIVVPYRDLGGATWPILILTALMGGGAYAIPEWQRRGWYRRQTQALQDLAMERGREKYRAQHAADPAGDSAARR